MINNIATFNNKLKSLVNNPQQILKKNYFLENPLEIQKADIKEIKKMSSYLYKITYNKSGEILFVSSVMNEKGEEFIELLKGGSDIKIVVNQKYKQIYYNMKQTVN
ncbi:hypothetical protein NUSPORA_01385 [Nucleospora cyclopteri]